MSVTITITVAPDAAVTVGVEGAPGKTCHDVTAAIESALGKTVKDTPTKERYARADAKATNRA